MSPGGGGGGNCRSVKNDGPRQKWLSSRSWFYVVEKRTILKNGFLRGDEQLERVKVSFLEFGRNKCSFFIANNSDFGVKLVSSERIVISLSEVTVYSEREYRSREMQLKELSIQSVCKTSKCRRDFF